MPKPKLVSVGFGQRKWRIILAHAMTEQYDEHVLSLLKDAEHTQDWRKEEWIDVLGRCTD